MGQSTPGCRLSPTGLWGLTVAKERETKKPASKLLMPDGPARAGVQASDRLLVLDDRWTDSVNDCYAAA